MVRRFLTALAAFKLIWDAYPRSFILEIEPELQAGSNVYPSRNNFTIAPNDFESTALVDYSEYRNITKH